MAKRGKNRDRDRKRDNLLSLKRREAHRVSLVNRILKFDDPVLSKVCDRVEKDEDINVVVNDLTRILASTDNGVGLAASQIGVTKRIIALRFNIRKNVIRVMINPEIVEHGDEIITGNEACLSYPGVVANVPRFAKIKVKFETVDRKVDETWFNGYEARVFAHETDHLNGACLVGQAWRERHKSEELKADQRVKTISV